MASRLLALFCILTAACLLGCAGARTEPRSQTVTILFSDYSPGMIARIAGALRSQRELGPVIWLIKDSILGRSLDATLTDGLGPVAILNRAGVDAVLLTPDWLGFGQPRLGELVSQARFYLLSASLLDTAGQSLGHHFMVKRYDEGTIAITGVLLESSARRTCLSGVRKAEAELAARKAEALMRQRADLVGALVSGADSMPGWGLDFIIGAGSGQAASVTTPKHIGFQTGLSLDLLGGAAQRFGRGAGGDYSGFEPDSAVQAAVDSVNGAVHSAAARPLPAPRPAVTPEWLTRKLVTGTLAEDVADAFLYDSLVNRDGFREPKDVGTLALLLRDPRRLALLSLTGDSIRTLAANKAWTITLKPGMSRAGLSGRRVYRVAATVEFLQRHSELTAHGYDLSGRPLWTMAAEILESGQVK